MGKRVVSTEAQQQGDMVTLVALPEFQRFLFRVMVASGMCGPAGGSDDRHLCMAEGRRNLGLELFRWADDALSVSNATGLPLWTLFSVLRYQVQPPGGTNAPQSNQIVDDDEPDEPRRI